MTFDARSRQAAQGIRRAVEVMEMSSTKTPQRLTRFDRYQDGKSRNKRIAALTLGIAVSVLLVVTAVVVLGSKQDPNLSITSPSVPPAWTPGHSGQFREAFTYMLPPGWSVENNDHGWLALNPAPTEEPDISFYVLMNVRAMRPDCSDVLNENVGASSDATTRWLSQHPALDATAPRPITLGAASGSWVDVQLAPGRDVTCPNGLPLLSNPKGGESWGIEHNTDKIRFYVLDLPDGNTVTVVVDVRHASDFEHAIEQVAPVVKTFDFSG